MTRQKRRLKPISDKGYDVVPFDEEERQIMDDLAAGHYVPVPRKEFAKTKSALIQAAKNANRKVPMTMRVEALTLDLIKLRAKRQGLPYQTMISSLLFKFARGDVIERK